MISTLTALALLATPDATACGGFFCQQVPIDQAAERILFALDEEAGQVEMHITISFEGDAKDFAWVVPVPAKPELRTTVDDVLTSLGNATFPQFNLAFEVEGECDEDTFAQADGAVNAPTAAGGEADDAGGKSGGVEVVGSGAVGPYEYEILAADDAQKLYDYLIRNAYVLPPDVQPKLEPYVAGGSFFVALRLQQDKGTGDLQPLALTYPGTEPVIPLRLTAVAATPDMRLQPYVLGSARAVPESYLHVRVNPFAIDWLQAGSNYADVITQAADIAGGQAFATDYAQPTSALRGTLWSPGRYDAGPLRRLGKDVRANRVMDAFQFDGGYPVSTGTSPFLSQVIPVPPSVTAQGVSDLSYWSCIECWSNTVPLVDATKLADLMQSEWEPAMKHAQELIDARPWITRLTSSMDADEMTVDPTFVLNPDMGEVSNQWQATLVTECGNRAYTFFEAPRRLQLPDGRSMPLPPQSKMDGFDWATYAAGAGFAVETVEKTGRTGAPQVVTDYSSDIAAGLAALSDEAEAERLAGACSGCGSSGGAPWGALAVLGGLALRRRR